jgi:hypothetical protein
MCQITVEWLFDRMWPSHIRKVASLFAQALRRVFSQERSCWSQLKVNGALFKRIW